MAALPGGCLAVADEGNHRVVVLDVATRAFGRAIVRSRSAITAAWWRGGVAYNGLGAWRRGVFVNAKLDRWQHAA